MLQVASYNVEAVMMNIEQFDVAKQGASRGLILEDRGQHLPRSAALEKPRSG